MEPQVTLEIPIGSLMSRSVLHLREQDGLDEAVELMVQAKSSCVVICRALVPRGIVTERDVTMLYTSPLPPSRDVPLASVMRAPVHTVCETDTLGDVLGTLERLTSHHIPVVDANGELSGLVTQTDLLRACACLILGAPSSGG